ncbi:hypothetical protein QP027_07580 [Corynebacterium breve]|uniref:Uncharacterized protein n=1 Tax=Corynebacterium breve TaxID=3049799 RepID=A0ABY8VC31_9CORY|nr:hypothetical protein [Corynebacterium breve]WIM66989.1 hypothetical protein QP027_07580 [Corynebacterium breve]
MDRSIAIRIGLVTVLIVAYIAAAAVDFHRQTVAPIIVIAIAVVMFFPRPKTK